LQMISLRLQRYAGRKLKAGDEFVASRRDAKLLKRMGMAAVAPSIAPVVPVEAEAVIAKPIAVQETVKHEEWESWRRDVYEEVPGALPDAEPVATPAETLEPAAEDAPRTKRKYTRRDMTAE